MAFGGFESVKAIGADEIEEEFGEVGLDLLRRAGADMAADLLVYEFSHHHVEGMGGADFCHFEFLCL